MIGLSEARFYKSIHRAAKRVGLIADRMENSIGEGWPDVLLRGEENYHAWAELKIAKGPNARIEVRPEQVNWIEDHAARGGIVHLLAWNSRDIRQFWCVDADSVRFCAAHGCVNQPCYLVSQIAPLFSRWMGNNVYLQPQDPTLAQKRAKLEENQTRRAGSGAVLSIVRRPGIRNSGNHRRSHYSESPWGD